MKNWQLLILAVIVVSFVAFETFVTLKKLNRRKNAVLDVDLYSDFLAVSYQFYTDYEGENYEITTDNTAKYETGRKIVEFIGLTGYNIADTLEYFTAQYIDEKYGEGYFYAQLN